MGFQQLLESAVKGKWKDKSFTDANGPRRWVEFKTQFEKELKIGTSEDDAVDLSEFKSKTWEECLQKFNLNKFKNPASAKMVLIRNGKQVEFKDLERKSRDGTNAAKMEIFVLLYALADVSLIENDEDVVDKFIEVVLNNRDEYEKYRVTEKEVLAVIDLLDVSYAKTFIDVAKQLKNLGLNGRGFQAFSHQKWHEIKASFAAELSAEAEIKIAADKWNPADIFIFRRSTKSELKEFLNPKIDVFDRFEAFNRLVEEDKIFPISIKKDKNAIQGSRGVTTVISTSYDKEIDIVSAHDALNNIIETEIIQKTKGKFKTQDVHRRVANYILDNGSEAVKFLEQSYDIARSRSEMSASFYIVNNEEIKAVESLKNNYSGPKLVKIGFPDTANQVQLKFADGGTASVRYKGGTTLYVSVEKKSL